jgi:hypothetical protein
MVSSTELPQTAVSDTEMVDPGGKVAELSRDHIEFDFI